MISYCLGCNIVIYYFGLIIRVSKFDVKDVMLDNI
jgi:hypothetical protein